MESHWISVQCVGCLAPSRRKASRTVPRADLPHYAMRPLASSATTPQGSRIVPRCRRPPAQAAALQLRPAIGLQRDYVDPALRGRCRHAFRILTGHLHTPPCMSDLHADPELFATSMSLLRALVVLAVAASSPRRSPRWPCTLAASTSVMAALARLAPGPRFPLRKPPARRMPVSPSALASQQGRRALRAPPGFIGLVATFSFAAVMAGNATSERELAACAWHPM